MDRTAELHADAPNSATAVGGTESYAALPDLCRLPGTAPVAPEQSSRAGPRADRPIAMDGPGAQTRLWTVPPLGAGRHVLRAAVGGRLSVPVAKRPRGSVPTAELRIERWWRLMPWTHRQRAGVDLDMGAAETRHLVGVPERLGRACNYLPPTPTRFKAAVAPCWHLWQRCTVQFRGMLSGTAPRISSS
jgi:hypothetical protein